MPVPQESTEAPEPQPVLSPLTAAAVFLVLTIEPGGEDAVRDLLGDVSALQRSVGFRTPGGALQVVAAIGSDAWDRLFAGPRPAGLHPFRELTGPRHTAPATAGDLLFHIRANRMDLCFEYTTQVMARLAGAVTVVDEEHGFRYFDERDLIGFVDGTESPSGPGRGQGRDRRPGRRPGLRRRQLRHHPEVPARPARLERDQRRGAGAGDRPVEAGRHRDAGRCEAAQLARRAQHGDRPGRRGSQDHPGEHAVRPRRARASSGRTTSPTPPPPTSSS